MGMTWYVIRTMTGYEFEIRDELQADGNAVIVPNGWRLKKKRPRGYEPIALLPGYVFASWGKYYPDWYGLAHLKGWLGPLRIDGMPARLSASVVEKAEQLTLPKPSLSETPRKPKVGDRIGIKYKLLTELRVEVAALEERGRIRVNTPLFGGVQAEVRSRKLAVPDAA